jgi:hypothetical protein
VKHERLEDSLKAGLGTTNPKTKAVCEIHEGMDADRSEARRWALYPVRPLWDVMRGPKAGDAQGDRDILEAASAWE